MCDNITTSKLYHLSKWMMKHNFFLLVIATFHAAFMNITVEDLESSHFSKRMAQYFFNTSFRKVKYNTLVLWNTILMCDLTLINYCVLQSKLQQQQQQKQNKSNKKPQHIHWTLNKEDSASINENYFSFYLAYDWGLVACIFAEKVFPLWLINL